MLKIRNKYFNFLWWHVTFWKQKLKHYEKDKNFEVVVGKQRQGLLLVGPTIYDGVHILHTLSFFPSLNHRFKEIKLVNKIESVITDKV
ncbi:hypothetical protein QL285_060065 [Trifolium repens]|nr:hypothetical protein QL285_060065 [Trifolium repens]